MNKTENMKQLLSDTWNAKKGLAAFNYSDIWDLIAIANAAEKMNVDVVVASNPFVMAALGIGVCQAMIEALNAKTGINLFNHLDHSSNVELCIQAIDAGYPSVMIDGSKHSLEENIRMTKEVVEYGHKKNVIVEGEIGKIKGAGIEGDFAGGAFLAEVDDAVALVEGSGLDSLAVGIGTAHGFYTEEPNLHFDRLAEIASAVDVPLVLHGGTGIPDADIQKAITMGITKVNIGTAIHTAYMTNLRKELNNAEERPYTLDIMKNVLPYIEDVVIDRIKVITKA